MDVFAGVGDVEAAVGRELGPGPWTAIEQPRIDGFAEHTEDRQWIHVDPERARSGPFGTTVAHGFLTLALVPHLLDGLRTFEHLAHAVNYGLEKVRFPAAVPVGGRVRARAVITEAEPLDDGGVHMVTRATVELEDGSKPACIADVVTRAYFSTT
jgi:acyl dehydratase